LLARVFCVVLALVGVVPVLTVIVARSNWARQWAMAETGKLLKSQGLSAQYELRTHFWPISAELVQVRVDSIDGGAPALVCDRIQVRPRLFALLAGKLVVDQVEIDSPQIRVVLDGDRITNLGFDLPKSEKTKDTGPWTAPFDVLSITDARLDLDVRGVLAQVEHLDVDVNVDVPTKGADAVFEIASHLSEARVRTKRQLTRTEKKVRSTISASFEDSVCDVTARLRLERKSVFVRRLSARGFADLDPEGTNYGACPASEDSLSYVLLDLNHFSVQLPIPEGKLPTLAGQFSVRAPLGLVMRADDTPKAGGWVAASGELSPVADSELPDLELGRVTARDVQVDHYKFATALESEFTVRKGVVRSPRTKVNTAQGVALLREIVVEPLKPGIPLRTSIDVADVSFTALLRELGIHPKSHVQWDLDAIHSTEIKGTLEPLHLDGDLLAHTKNFGVFTAPAESKDRGHIITVATASVQAHFAVRPDGVVFQNASVDFPRGRAEGGTVYLHFNNDLLVRVPRVKVDLADITPLGSVPLSGVLEGELNVGGTFGDPTIKADASIQNFVLGGIPFGTITQARGTYEGKYVDLSNVVAKKGKSTYELATGRLDFRGPATLKVDGVMGSQALGFRDLLGVFNLEDDPRYANIDGTIQTRSTFQVILGGPDDPCGGGRIDVSSTAQMHDVTLFGERFDDAHFDFDLRWIDREAGLAGAELEVHGATLHKIHKDKGTPLGWVLATANIHRGGALRGTVVVESMPLGKLDFLGPQVSSQLEGFASGLLHVDGQVDAFRIDGDFDSSIVRIRQTQMPSSRIHFTMTQKPPTDKAVGATRCGAPKYAPFNRASYLADTSSQGDFIVSGDLFGGQLKLSNVTLSRQKNPRLSGKATFNDLDLGAISHMVMPPTQTGDDEGKEAFGGKLSGDLVVDRLVTNDLPHASLRFLPKRVEISRDKQKLVLRPTKDALELENDALVVPPFVFDLSAQGGLRGSALLRGSVTRITRDPELLLDAELSPIDLGFMVGVVPKVNRATGTLAGALSLRGRAKDPQIDGALRVRGAEFGVQGMPGAISDVEIDVRATDSEARITRAQARFAGGDIRLTDGRMSLRGNSFGAWELALAGRDLHFAPTQGLDVTLDTDLRIAQNPGAQGPPSSRLPHITGDINLASCEYTRPTNIVPDLGGFKVGAKRTNVETYDPSADALILGPNLTVHSRAPLKIRNNLVDMQFGVDSRGLEITGSNQRVGVRGELRAQSGGRFRVFANDFEVQRAVVRFDDPTRIAPHVDALAVTEYRRYGTTGQSAGASAPAGAVSGRTAGLWRIALHAYGDADDVRLDMTSDPPLSKEDIFLLLTIGLTRAEVDQVQAGSVAASAAFEALGTASGADRAVRQAIPVIDDFRFGSAYSPRTGRSEPQVTLGRRVTDKVRASVTTGLGEDRQLRTVIEWRLNQRLSVQSSYDNLNTLSSSSIGNLGFDLRWRLEFE
jgi:translocation and assembly module TamB